MTTTLLLGVAGGAPDGLTIGVGAITAVGVAVAAAVKAYRVGRASRTEIEPNPLNVSMVSELATKDEMRELEGRLVGEIRKLESQVQGERSIARTANSNIHFRLDKMAEKSDLTRIHERIDAQAIATASAASALGEVKSNVNQLLAIALNRKPQAPRA